jgi:hypothetical protein
MNASVGQRERDIHRIIELVRGLDSEMSSEVLDAESKVRTTISLSPDLLAQGHERARARNPRGGLRMKYSEVIQAAPRTLMRRDQAALRVGANQLFVLMEKFKWIKPCLQRHRMTLFDSREVDRCIDRIANGEYPGENQEGMGIRQPPDERDRLAAGRSSMSRSEGDKCA